MIRENFSGLVEQIRSPGKQLKKKASEHHPVSSPVREQNGEQDEIIVVKALGTKEKSQVRMGMSEPRQA